jgi:protein TonB
VITQELTQPLKVPQKIAQVNETPTPEQSAASPPVIGGVPGGVAGGQMGGVIGGVLNGAGTAIPKVAEPKHVRVSQGVSEGLLVHKVTPRYPALAKQARVQGSVVPKAEIGKDGRIEKFESCAGSSHAYGCGD